jgi:hypothetical protein
MAILNPHDSTTWPIGYRREKRIELTPMNDAQMIALRRVFDRSPLNLKAHSFETGHGERAMTFEEFRASVEHGSGCVMVYWCGMWLGIEPDGYTHS